jgi:hypothetical protein
MREKAMPFVVRERIQNAIVVGARFTHWLETA